MSYFKYKPAPKQISVPRMSEQFHLMQGHSHQQLLPPPSPIANPNVTNIADWVNRQPGKVFKG